MFTGPGSTDGGIGAELDSLLCDPVPRQTMNNAAREGPADAPQHVLTGRDGRGSTTGEKVRWRGTVRLLTITSKAPDGRHTGLPAVDDANQ